MAEPDRFVNSTPDIICAMETYGGSFVKGLASLYHLADSENKARLEKAFWHYFVQYDEMTTLARQRTAKA